MTAPLLDEEQEMAYLEVAVEAVMLGSGAPVAALVAERERAERERCAVIVDTLMRREAAKHYVEHPDIYEQDLKLYVLSDVARAIRGAS